MQESISAVNALFDFIYKKQTERPAILALYWTDYRLEALWIISVITLIGLILYKRFHRYRKFQSSTFIIGLELTSDNNECEIITLRRFSGCMKQYHIHSPTIIQSIQLTMSLTRS